MTSAATVPIHLRNRTLKDDLLLADDLPSNDLLLVTKQITNSPGDSGRGTNRSNDSGCMEQPPASRAGSFDLSFEFDLQLPKGTAPLAPEVGSLENEIPDRVAKQMGIFCSPDDEEKANQEVNDEEDEDEGPAGRRLRGAGGIYRLGSGGPDEIQEGVACHPKFASPEYDCVVVVANIEVGYDMALTNEEDATKHVNAYLRAVMRNGMIRTPSGGQAGYVGTRWTSGASGAFAGSPSIAAATAPMGIGEDESAPARFGIATLAGVCAVGAVVLVVLALLVARSRRRSGAGKSSAHNEAGISYGYSTDDDSIDLRLDSSMVFGPNSNLTVIHEDLELEPEDNGEVQMEV